jgi:hypothetical protein
MSKFTVGQRVRIIGTRLKGETAEVIGDSNLNMNYVVVVRRDNPRARKPILAFAPKWLSRIYHHDRKGEG